MTLSIVLADDHAAFRSSLKAQLERQPGVSVVMEAAGGRGAIDAVEACGETPPDLLLLDMDLRDLSGLQVARALLDLRPALRILVLSWYDDRPLVRAAAAAGCRGYMLKDDPLPELVHAIEVVASGGVYLSATLRGDQNSGDPISAFC